MIAARRKIERVVLLDQVNEVLKERILDHVDALSERLSIDALARELQASSTPLREALRRLTAEGVATATPSHGFSMQSLS
ncbi:GntR family transcriptional regulator [Geminicoccus roseus]|uniref:GntR family transcriptional regulator n=1 Tax=Geminicoccus roseus TaxID=404900 RepID=UPI000480D3BB|nr:GntR family transcriptional regulator [Geminicoccus roseus]